MSEESTTGPVKNRRLLKALAASIKSLEPDGARRLKENADQQNIILLIDVLTAIERKPGLHVDVFRLVAVAKRAITGTLLPSLGRSTRRASSSLRLPLALPTLRPSRGAL